MQFETKFERSMEILQSMFGTALSKTVIQVYHKSLKESLTVDELERACKFLCDNWEPTASRKFPVIAEFLKNSGKVSEEDRAQKAIEAVRKAVSSVGSYQSVSFGDSALHRTIRVSSGGWTSICMWTDEDWGFHVKKFKEMYLTQRRTGGEDVPHIGGHHELDPKGLAKVEFVPVLEGETRPLELGPPGKFLMRKRMNEIKGVNDASNTKEA